MALARWGGFSADRLYYGTDTRAGEFLVGAILGLAVASRRPSSNRSDEASPAVLNILGLGACMALVAAWALTPRDASWLTSGGLGVYALVSGVAIVAIGSPGTIPAHVLGGRPLRSLGRISYGCYLYHWPVLLLLSPGRVPGGEPARLVAAAGVTTGLAAASYHFVERPIRTRSNPYRESAPPSSSQCAPP